MEKNSPPLEKILGAPLPECDISVDLTLTQSNPLLNDAALNSTQLKPWSFIQPASFYLRREADVG